ncbi:MAG: methyltransferase domain-containing protein [Candidatus Omnitrophota bacterium]
MVETVCNLCGSNSYFPVYGPKRPGADAGRRQGGYKITEHGDDSAVSLVRCRRCGLIYVNPRPSADKVMDLYAGMQDDLYTREEKGRRLAAVATLKTLKGMRKGGRLLDIGCAAGFFLCEARKYGWDVFGVEPSKWASDYAREKLGLDKVFRGVFRDAGYPDNYFDAIVMNDTIEHLADPKGILNEIRRALKPDGILCVSTPDIDSLASRLLKARWWGVKESHLNYFTRKTLTKMLNDSGFVPVSVRGYSRYFTIGYLLDGLKGRSPLLYRLAAFFLGNKRLADKMVKVDFGDQLEIFSRKARRLEYLHELEKPSYADQKRSARITAVLPAYNASGTLERTVADIPREIVNDIILVDDASSDDTVKIAEGLGLKVYRHDKRKGYGGNQKTCYEKALELGSDIVIMVHPDYQYDPKIIPQLVEPILAGRADAVFGSRMMKGGALEGGMPLWKHNANILLTAVENVVFGTYLTEYHSGFRAYSGKALRTADFKKNSDSFIFDTEIIAQLIAHNLKIEEVPIKTRYFDEASSIKFLPSIMYGLGILGTLSKYWLHMHTFIKLHQFK